MLASLLGITAAQAVPVDEPRMTYVCTVVRTIDGVRLTSRASVYSDGQIGGHVAIWWGGDRPGMDYELIWPEPDANPPEPGPALHLEMAAERRVYAHIELHRLDRHGAPTGRPVVGTLPIYSRLHVLDVPWRRVDGAARAAGGIAVLLIGSDGQVIAHSSLDARPHDSGAAALVAMRTEVDAMVTDYRRRCTPEPEQQPIIT